MKKCPQCGSTYQDDTLSFCLSDGTALNLVTSAYSPEATLQLPEEQVTSIRQNAARVSVPVNQPTMQSAAPPSFQNTVAENKGSKLPLILGVLAVLGLLLLGGAALAYVAFSNRGNNIAQNTTPQPVVNSGVPVNQPDKTAELQEEVNKLKKMIEEQANANKKAAANKPVSKPSGAATPAPAVDIRIATVNSPGDGFLAMRTQPNSETGERIMKIPTGAQVAVGECLPYGKSGKINGRWCRVAYNGQTGWAFDAYLVY